MIPEGWESKELADLAHINMGQSPKSASYNEIGEGFYLIQGNADIKNRKSVPRTWTNEPTKICDIGDILMTVRAPVGAIALSKHKACIGRGVCSIRGEKIDNNFLYQYLIDFETKWKNLEQGSTFTAVGSNEVKGLKVLLPPLPEQKKIASILSSVDRAIEATQKVIDQTEKVKKGLLQELLTKGIGHTEFKKTEIGEIPVEWVVGKVSDIIDGMKSGLSRRIVSQDIGIPVLISGNIREGKLNTENIKYWYRTDPQGADVDKYILNDGDVLLCFINSISQIGKLCIFQDIGREAIYTTNLFRIIPKKGYSSEFLYFLFYTPYFQDEIQLITKPAVNQASFTKEDFLKIKIPIPKNIEQENIVSILSSVDESIQQATNKKEQLLKVKKGLMQDLLTGKVRVKV